MTDLSAYTVAQLEAELRRLDDIIDLEAITGGDALPEWSAAAAIEAELERRRQP